MGKERGFWIEENKGWNLRDGVERTKKRTVRPTVDNTASFFNLVKVGLTG